MWQTIRAVALSGLVFGPALLLWSIFRITMLVQRSVVARVPLTGRQEVTVSRPGDYVLSIEAPRLSNVSGLNYSLHESVSGQEVPLFPDVMRTRVSGWEMVRMAVRRFTIARAGPYVLQAYVPPGRDASRMSLVLSTSFLGSGFLAVIGIIAGAVLTLVGLIAL